jgi:alpha-tubulin suppressor-like RCC1 family protein
VQGIQREIVALKAGEAEYTYALAIDGTYYAWGENGAGQLGNNSTLNQPAPVVVP